MTTFGEDDWEGPLFMESPVSSNKTRLLALLQVKLKEEYHGIMMVQLPKSIL